MEQYCWTFFIILHFGTEIFRNSKFMDINSDDMGLQKLTGVFPFFRLDMEYNRLTQEMKRCAVIVAIHADHSDLEITIFLKVARSFCTKLDNWSGIGSI